VLQLNDSGLDDHVQILNFFAGGKPEWLRTLYGRIDNMAMNIETDRDGSIYISASTVAYVVVGEHAIENAVPGRRDNWLIAKLDSEEI